MRQAVSPVLLETIKELQTFKSLEQFALAGGTNLAFRYNHRESQDIDLFCPNIVGIKHFEEIENEVINYYGNNCVSGLQYPYDKESEQHTYLRFWLTKPCGTMIKVEIIQNMKMIESIEIIEDVKLVTTKDIGLFKLVSSASRAAKKDIYDLDFVTEKIPLIELFDALRVKKDKFNTNKDKNIFDLDGEECPVKNPLLLLKFDGKVTVNGIKRIHSNDHILIVEGGKNWIEVGISWRMKVRRLFNYLGLKYPLQ